MINATSGRQIAAWWIGGALALMITSGVGILDALISAFNIPQFGYLIIFAFSLSSVPATAGIISARDWIDNLALDTQERKARLEREYAQDSAVTLEETDALSGYDAVTQERAEMVRENLIEFIFWADRIGSLTGPDHLGKSVSSLAEWEYYAEILFRSRMVIKANGRPTIWHAHYSPARAIRDVERRRFELPNLDRRPPPISPCPAPVVVEHDPSGAKAKA